MAYCTNSHNWQNNMMGNRSVYALSAEEQQSALFNPCIALPGSKRKQCPHSIFLNTNVVLLYECQEETILHEIFTTALLWLQRLADGSIMGLRNLHIDLNSAYIPVALHLKDLFVIHTRSVSACCDLDRRARGRSKSCRKNGFHTCNGHPFFFFAHSTAEAISYLRSFT